MAGPPWISLLSMPIFNVWKKSNNWYHIHADIQLRLSFDLRPRPFDNVLFYFLDIMHGYVSSVIAMEIHGCSETIINLAKDLQLVFLTMARGFRFVGAGRASPAWILWALQWFSWWSRACLILSLHLRLFRGKVIMFCDAVLLVSRLSLFWRLCLFFPTKYLDTHSFDGVSMWGYSFGYSYLKCSCGICIIPHLKSFCSNAFSNGLLLPFCRYTSYQTPWLA